MKPEKQVILYDSPEAASIKTVTGWVSSTGRFWGQDEGMARWEGCTHRKCETDGCQNVLDKHSYTICPDCREERDRAKFEARPRAAWDGKAMLFSDANDEYFSDLGDAEDFAGLHDKTLADLRLVICEPHQLHELDSETWVDDLPEDGELPDEVQAALDALNEAIRASGTSCWFPGKFALDPSTIAQAAGRRRPPTLENHQHGSRSLPVSVAVQEIPDALSPRHRMPPERPAHCPTRKRSGVAPG